MGISDLSLTGTQSDVTSCTQILARYRGADKQQMCILLETQCLSLHKIIGALLMNAPSRKRSSLCNLISFKFKPECTGSTFPVGLNWLDLNNPQKIGTY